MKGALRVAALLFSGLRLQKLLLGVGMLVIGVGYLLPTPACRPTVVMGLIIPFVPSLFIAGLSLRYFVAPRSVRLIPHARVQMLGGLALFTLAVATISTVVAWTLGLDVKALPRLWLLLTAATSLVLIPQFMLSNSAWGMVTWFVTLSGLLGGVTNSPRTSVAREALRSIATNTELLIALIAALWVGFALWFLRVRTFSAPSAFSTAPAHRLKLNTTQETALRAFLFGNPSIRFQMTGSFAAAGFTALCWGIVFLLTNKNVSLVDGAVKALGVVLGLGAYAGIGGWHVARRSKSLWLRGGVDRMGLFRLCEAQAWKFFGVAATPVLVSLAIAGVLRPSVGLDYVAHLTLHFTSGACLLYLGLMHVRGWRVVDIVCAFVLGGFWIMTFDTARLLVDEPWLAPAVIAAMLAAAFALRLAAMHRWRRIDWLVCKLPRPPARNELRLAPQ